MSALSVIVWAGFCLSLVVLLPWPWGLVSWALLLIHMRIKRSL